MVLYVPKSTTVENFVSLLWSRGTLRSDPEFTLEDLNKSSAIIWPPKAKKRTTTSVAVLFLVIFPYNKAMGHKEDVKKCYDLGAEEYHAMVTEPDRGFWNNYVERPAMEKILKPIVRGKKVLDLGSGSGVSTQRLSGWGANVVGSDISEGMTEIARKENPNIEFVVESADETQFPNSYFDLVASSLMVHYLEDFKRLFNEVNRILKPKGIFVFSMQHPFDNSLGRASDDKEVRDKDEPIMLTIFPPTGLFKFKMAGMDISLYRHSISYVVNSLVEAGFEIDELVETMPIKEGKMADPARYEETSRRPTFLIIRATKK